MTVKGDSADAPLAAATTVPADNDGNNNNDAIPQASAVAVPIGGGDAGVVPLPVPMPPPAEENVVVKTVKTTKTYTIPAPSASNNSAAPSAPPATATAGGSSSSSSSPRLLKDLGRQPVSITCPHCNQVGLTRVESRCDAGSGASAAILCVVGFFCCICLAFAACLPCCVDKMQATEHRCSKCNRVVGKVRSFSDC